jgi:uncharacterized protein (DUF2141 family)
MACDFNFSSFSVIGDCQNNGSGSFTLNLSASSEPISITWFLPNPWRPGGSETVETGILSGPRTYSDLPAGLYVLEINDSCGGPSATTQNNRTTLNIYVSSASSCASITSVSATTCGLENGSLTAEVANVNGTVTYKLYLENNNNRVTPVLTPPNEPSDPDLIRLVSVDSGSLVFDSLPYGIYYVIADDGGGCTGRSENCIIQESTQLNYGLYPVNSSNCGDVSKGVGKILITGLTGVSPYTYLWSSPTPSLLINGQSLTGTSITGLTAGVYNVTVTDAQGCTYTQSAQISEVPPVTIQEVVPTPPTCFDPNGSIQITVINGTPPYRYYIPSINYIDISYNQTYTFSGLYGGIYDIIVTDSSLCVSPTQVILAQPNSFAVRSIDRINSVCGNNNGSITIILNGNANSDYNYSLTNTNGDVSVQTTSLSTSFNGLFPDTYTLKITDNICTYSGTVIISATSLYNITTQVTGTTCGGNNGVVEIFKTTGGTSPFIYSIQGGNGSYVPPSPQIPSSSCTFNNLSSGYYQVMVEDFFGCREINYFSIDDSEQINFMLIPTSSTNGSNGEIFANIYQGIPPFTLTWSSNVNGQTGTSINNLSAGTYTLTVQDNDGCAITKSVTLTGVFVLSNLSEYNICESTISSGNITERTLGKMLLEGYLDLTSGCVDCLLSSATFSAVATVAGSAFTQSFYTATTLNDVPANTSWYNTVDSLLSSVTGIGEVIVDSENNTITVNTSCEETTDTLSNQNVTVQVSILYDINCVSC